MKTIHILNGDCLAEQLKQSTIKGDFIICRECLVEGPVHAKLMSDFLQLRAGYFSDVYNVTKDEYQAKTISELYKIETLPQNSRVFLWFEDDLFCQVNFWFILSLLSDRKDLKMYRVFPVIKNESDHWKGFGISTTSELEEAFRIAILLTEEDLLTGKYLWKAFSENGLSELEKPGKINSPVFNKLPEVVKAHLDRFPVSENEGRPEKTIREIMDAGITEFQYVFAEFSKREGIYGFSDLQVKSMFDKVNRHH